MGLDLEHDGVSALGLEMLQGCTAIVVILDALLKAQGSVVKQL